MLGTSDMILVSVLAEVCSYTNSASIFVSCLGSGGAGGCLCLENLLGEDFGRDGREGSNTTLQVVSAVEECCQYKMRKDEEEPYCQSLRICPLCKSLFLNAT